MIELVKTWLYVCVMLSIGYAIFYVTLDKSAKREVSFKPLICALIFTSLSFLTPRIGLLHLILIAVIPALAKKREDILILYVFGILIIPGLPFTAEIGPLQLIEISLHDSLGLGALLALFSKGFTKSTRSPLYDLAFVGLLSFLILMAARETAISNWLRETVSQTLTYGIPYWVATRSMKDSASMAKLCLWLAAGAAMLSPLLIYEAISSWPFYYLLEQRFEIYEVRVAAAKTRGAFMRAEGPLREATAAGFVLVISTIALVAARSKFQGRLTHLLALALALGGIWAPQSRGAWIGILVGLAGLAAYRSASVHWIPRLAAAMVAGLAAVTVVRQFSRGEAESTLDYREQLWERGVEEFYRNPLTGDSYNDVVARMMDMVQGEQIVDFVNTYLYFALLGGVLGAVAFVLFLGTPLWLLTRRRRRLARGLDRDAGAFCFGAILSAATMFAFTSLIPEPALILTALVAMAGNLVMVQRASARRRMRPPADEPAPHDSGVINSALGARLGSP